MVSLVPADARLGLRSLVFGPPSRPHCSMNESVTPERRRSPLAVIARALFEWAKSLSLAIVLFLILRAFLVEAYRIPSGSMERTLLVGDFLLVNKLVYGAEIPFTSRRL